MAKWRVKKKRFLDRRSKKLRNSVPKRYKKAKGHVEDVRRVNKNKGIIK